MGKPPKAWCSFEDQADRLMKNGLKCSSRESLVEYLTTHNYYHLTFESWLRCLIKFRNLVAHNNRLYRYKVKETPKKSKIYPKLTGLIFDYIIVLRELYPYQDRMEWNEVFIRVISGTCKNNEHLELKEYGFPENWEEVIRIPDKST